MADIRITQKQNASLTYIDDWSGTNGRLKLAYPASTVTISSVVGTASAGTLSAVATAQAGTGITFHLATAAVTPPLDITVTLTATLSNGDVDVRTLIVGVI